MMLPFVSKAIYMFFAFHIDNVQYNTSSWLKPFQLPYHLRVEKNRYPKLSFFAVSFCFFSYAFVKLNTCS
jgi:hypothetical protein